MTVLAAEHRLEKCEEVQDVLLDEDFVPPHKMAGFVPYDIIFSVEGDLDEWDEERAEDLLDDTLKDYDEVLSVEENEYEYHFDGDVVVFVSLFSYS